MQAPESDYGKRIVKWKGFPVALLMALSLAVALLQPANAEDPTASSTAEILPPIGVWDGKSRSLVVPDDDPWQTPSEASGLVRTPSYEQTFEWLHRLAEASPKIHMESIGRSHEGRDIWMAVVSASGATTPQELRAAGKPVLLAHSGIHAGEIDGKDAGLMLLRDLTAGGSRSELLDSASLLFIPILNVDGHERSSAIGRVNQRGPERMGWRTNARNQNLNRDFAKLDTPELRAWVGVVEAWSPDLYLDLHVTDGADYQYDITWGYNGPVAWSPKIAEWLAQRFDPVVGSRLEEMGHVPGPLIFAVNYTDFSKGVRKWAAGPRYSNGYGDARHLPTVLVENHSLKPYDRRVLGTYVLLDAALTVLGKHSAELRAAVAADRAGRPDPVPLGWEKDPEVAPDKFLLASITHRSIPSEVMGTERIEWLGEAIEEEVDYYRYSRPSVEAGRPAAYWVPPVWPEVIERLELHGIEMERIEAARAVDVGMYRLRDPKLDSSAFEGRVRLDTEFDLEHGEQVFAAGSVRVSTDQDLGTLAMLLLEPGSPDSFLQTGFFQEILQRTEYMESYLIDAMVEELLKTRPELEEEFQRKLVDDPEFAASARSRMSWYYERSPYVDERWKLYPVARESAPAE